MTPKIFIQNFYSCNKQCWNIFNVYLIDNLIGDKEKTVEAIQKCLVYLFGGFGFGCKKRIFMKL